MNTTTDPLSHASLHDLTVILVWLRYASVICPVLLFHDFLLTLDDEVCLTFVSFLLPPPYRFASSQIRLVWPGSISLPKALYCMNRHLCIIATTMIAYR